MKIKDFNRIVFFTGAGMSAESGVPTYRGNGGIWNQYRWEEYACQKAFDNNPQAVLDFHELRRIEALKCEPHLGHRIIQKVQNTFQNSFIITQNIDGMHQRALSNNIIELHGSIWRIRCDNEKLVYEDLKYGHYNKRKCKCGNWLRPDIVWFQDNLDKTTLEKAKTIISKSELFISIGTSAVVWPAAGYAQFAKNIGVYCIEINPEDTELSYIFDKRLKMKASSGLQKLFEEYV
tara:strand:- start:356 stop:1057 length:702 start_codon:yes stop_codon:yes gene_type:complete